MRDVFLRDLTSSLNMGHNTLGLDSGKEWCGRGAVDQAHPNKKQMGIVAGTDERAEPGAQFIQCFQLIIFRQAKILQVHPVTCSPQECVCIYVFPVFKSDLPVLYVPYLGMMASDRVKIFNREGPSRNELMFTEIKGLCWLNLC